MNFQPYGAIVMKPKEWILLKHIMFINSNVICLCVSLSDALVQRQKALTELGQKGDAVLQETSLDKGKNSVHAE